jgi:hypothetical protein
VGDEPNGAHGLPLVVVRRKERGSGLLHQGIDGGCVGGLATRASLVRHRQILSGPPYPGGHRVTPGWRFSDRERLAPCASPDVARLGGRRSTRAAAASVEDPVIAKRIRRRSATQVAALSGRLATGQSAEWSDRCDLPAATGVTSGAVILGCRHPQIPSGPPIPGRSPRDAGDQLGQRPCASHAERLRERPGHAYRGGDTLARCRSGSRRPSPTCSTHAGGSHRT